MLYRLLALSSLALLSSCKISRVPTRPDINSEYAGAGENSEVVGDNPLVPGSTTPTVGDLDPVTAGSGDNGETITTNVYDLKNAISFVSRSIQCSDAGLGIVGGEKANSDDLVTASTFRIVLNRNHFCTATLVGNNQLLTAAHCFEDISRRDQIDIGFGPDGNIVENLKVKDFKIHPDYKGMRSITTANPEAQLFDIAIIAFEGKISGRMKPALIAEDNFAYTGMPLVVAGYGANGSRDSARRPLSWIITELSNLNNKFNEIQIKRKPGRGACFGDSGGPAYIVDSDERCLQLVGSISGPSRGTSDCESGGGLLMDVTRHREWISCGFKKLGSPLSYIIPTEASCPD